MYDSLKIRYTLVFLFASFWSLGQENLILNGDFEEYWECPDDVKQIERCKYVCNPCENTLPESSSDYFNACYVSGSGGALVGIPNTPFAYQNAFSGNGMLGFGSEYNSSNQYEYREYIQLSFLEKLKCGKKYRFVGHFNLANYCRYSIKNIGFYFSETELNDADFLYNLYTPQYTDSITVIEDTLNWTILSFEFVADRAYSYVSLGHFKKDSSLSFVEVNPNAIFNGFSTYFFIDQCSLSEVNGSNIELQNPNIFTPNNDGVNDFFQPFGELNHIKEVLILNRWGNHVISLKSPFIWDGLNSEGNKVSNGVYYCIIQTKSSCKMNKEQVGIIHVVY